MRASRSSPTPIASVLGPSSIAVSAKDADASIPDPGYGRAMKRIRKYRKNPIGQDLVTIAVVIALVGGFSYAVGKLTS
jgi:hypothetical protein